jgi:O-antigen/teichoic acid export membrane protein
VVVFLALTAGVSAAWGREAALAWIGVVFTLALALHGWWTRRNGIRFLDPEPWDRYRALRGWTG